MDIDRMSDLFYAQQLSAVNFVESGSGPFVIEVEFRKGSQLCKELLKDKAGDVVTCKNLKEGYGICEQVGVHEANLVQIVPHDEACTSEYADYHKELMPLRF